MDERVATLLSDLSRGESLSPAELQRCARRANWLPEFSADQFAEFLTAVGKLPLPQAAVTDRLLGVWLAAAVQARRQALARGSGITDDAAVAFAIAAVYPELGKPSRARGQLLVWLAVGARPSELDLL